MKRVFSLIVALGLAAVAAWAQDYNAAMEVYNKAAQAENKAEQIAGFREAMGLFAACEDEDAPAQVALCKENIVKLSFSIVNDLVKGKQYDDALAALDNANAAAAEFEQDAAERSKKLQGAIYNGLAKENFKANPAVAAENAQKAIDIDEDNGATYLFLGMAKVQLKEADAAIEAFEKASELGMSKQAAGPLSNQYVNKAVAANKAGKFADAVEFCGKAIAANEGNANAYKIRGNAYVSLNKIEDGIADFEKYLEVNPSAKDAAQVKTNITQLKAAKK
jgi:tetratricopeptide (TPR) repeat protein